MLGMTLDSDNASEAGPAPSSENPDTLPSKSHHVHTKDRIHIHNADRMTLGSDDTSAVGPTPSSEKNTLPPKSHDVLTKDHNTEDSALFNSPATLEGKPTPPTRYFLDKVPPEIRGLIYEQLLRSRGPMNKAHKLNGINKTFLCKHYSPIDDIDSTILRTCRSVYDEARPILYGLNHFYSDNLEHIEQFAYDGLTHDLHSTDFAFRRRIYGRLSEVRDVSLRLSQCSSIYRTVEQAEEY